MKILMAIWALVAIKSIMQLPNLDIEKNSIVGINWLPMECQ